MSCSIQFVRLNDFIADIDVLDFSTAGYSLAQDGYFQVSAPDGVSSVREVLTLKLQGTSKDDLAAMTQEIDEKVKQVGWWLKNPGVERYQVWLRVQLENESLPRQAQILSIMPPDKVRTFTPEERIDNYLGSYSIAFERTPFWEDPYPYPNTTTKTSLNALGDKVALSETINGDVPARLARFAINPHGVGDEISTYWAGWKSSRFGNPANFTPAWSLNLAGYLGTDTSATSDSSAYNGNRITCTFGTSAALVSRAVITLSDVISDSAKYADQRGSYTVLLRAMVDSGTKARARMLYSFGASGVSAVVNPTYRSRRPIEGIYWSYYEMGTVSIPAMRIPSGFSLKNFSIEIDAERTAGSGSLFMDCLILIPIDDGAIKAVSPSDLPIATSYLSVFQGADASLSSFVELSNIIVFSASMAPTGAWGLPANSDAPTLVIATQHFTGGNNDPINTKGDVVDFSYTYIPRWRTLRGNVT